MLLTVPAGYLPGSERQAFRTTPPAACAPGAMLKLHVHILASPLPTEVDPEEAEEGEGDDDAHTTVGAAQKRTWAIGERAAELGLAYVPQPNPHNTAQAWPILEEGGFANLRPEYFQLPEQQRLFKQRFGFACWEDAEVFFNTSFPTIARKRGKAILSPFFQFLAALWRMKAAPSVEELACYFGVTRWKMVRT